MKRRDRYATSGLLEDQREPGSHGRVLKNLLGIKSKREMDRIEGREQVRALEELTAQLPPKISPRPSPWFMWNWC